MKAVTRQVEQVLWVYLRAAVLSAGAIWMFAGCQGEAPGHLVSVDQAIRDQQSSEELTDDVEVHVPDARERALQAFDNSAEPSAVDSQRLASALAAKSAQEQQELAAYARLQFEQRLELAAASAPRIYVSGDENPDASTLGQWNMERREGSIALTGHPSRKYREQVSTGGAIDAPDRDYVRSVLEDSADKSVADSAERQQDSNAGNGAPFGNPVPGKPGYVTSPDPPVSRGYIDVRGYNPGSTVIDPYTGQSMRVP